MNSPPKSVLPTTGGVIRPLLILGVPVLAEEALNLLVGYTDWFLAGRFLPGDEPVAAMGLLAYFMWMLPSLFSFVSIGALAMVARFVGSGDQGQASHVANQAMRLGVIAAAVGMLAVGLLGGWFVAAMQLQGTAAVLAQRYIWIITPAIPFIMIEQVGTSCLRGAGDTVSGLLARVAVNVVDAVLSAALVTGYGLFPNLGWEGLAIGTACGHAVGGTIILALLWSGRSGLKLRVLKEDLFDRPLVRRIFRIGVPGAFDLLAVIGCHLVYAAIINRLGTLSQAAHGLGVQIEALSYLSGSAFQVAAATLAGQSLGAGDARRAMRGALTSCGAAMATMSAAGVIFFVWGESLAWFFTGEYSATTQLTGDLLKIVAISCPFLAILQVFSGTLRGSGDTSWPLAITFIGLVGVRIPAACVLAWDQIPLPFTELAIPGLGLGVIGAWYAMVADVLLRSLLITLRFWHGGWQRVKV